MRFGKGIALVALIAALLIVAVIFWSSNDGMAPGGVAQPTEEGDVMQLD